MSYKVPFVDYPKQCRTLKKELMPVIKGKLTDYYIHPIIRYSEFKILIQG